MGIKGLNIIGETINDSVPKVRKLFEEEDLQGLVEIAEVQERMGAAYIDVNIGRRDPDLMAQLVKFLQEHVSVPLSIDSPDPAILKAGLEAYDPSKANGKIALVNSIAETRIEILDLRSIQPFRAILIGSERKEGGRAEKNRTGGDVLKTAKRLTDKARRAPYHMANDDLIIDPGIAPIGADTEGVTKMALDAIRLIRQEVDLREVHLSVGLSNFSAMLPSKRADGSPVKIALENAFLTLAVSLGLDYIIGNVAKDYKLLNETDPAYRVVTEAIELGGLESIMKIRQFYTGDK
jgi:cobalamin-dependent methionine synthase I